MRAMEEQLELLEAALRGGPGGALPGATPPARVFLVGFMGSGKSTVGRLLAAGLGWHFVDLDEAIERRAGSTVADIFRQSGEAHFRALERELLADSAAGPERTVVALGGGAFASAANRAAVAAAGVSVWLDVPFEVAAARAGGDAGRPLARTPEQMRGLFDERLASYREADIRVPVGDLTPESAALGAARSLAEHWARVAERRGARP